MNIVTYALIDAARDYVRIGLARSLSLPGISLFEGAKGQQLEDVAPHLFLCDPVGQMGEILLAPDGQDGCGVLLDARIDVMQVRRHLRHFLLVRRQRDMKKVYFRFYDPRVLRAFLPACTAHELTRFFGPITAFHCQGDNPGEVLTFTLSQGKLQLVQNDWKAFLTAHFPKRQEVAARIIASPST